MAHLITTYDAEGGVVSALTVTNRDTAYRLYDKLMGEVDAGTSEAVKFVVLSTDGVANASHAKAVAPEVVEPSSPEPEPETDAETKENEPRKETAVLSNGPEHVALDGGHKQSATVDDDKKPRLAKKG